MNRIVMQKVRKNDNWTDFEWFIDDVRLSEYLKQRKVKELPANTEPFDNLCPAWTKGLDYFGDVRFTWELLTYEEAVLPIYLCPDDLDYSCIVIVVEVKKTKDFVYWERFGLVNCQSYDFSEEALCGILYLEGYTDKDWERYGDNIAISEVNSEEWCQWISENWDEELFRRRMNYTRSAYQKEENIIWFAEVDWCFERNVYEDMVQCYWEQETLEEVQSYHTNQMTVKDCAHLIKKLKRTGSNELIEHIDTYGEILLHLYASEQVGEPLVELLKHNNLCDYVEIYCRTIELMWRYGDDAVKNVVDVTLLERLSDDEAIWRSFGHYISGDFKKYINEELLNGNIAMFLVGKLP